MSYLVVSLARDFSVARRITESLQPVSPRVFVMDHGERETFARLEVVEHPRTSVAGPALAGAAIGGAASAAALAVPFVGPFIFALTAPVAAATGGLVGAAVGGTVAAQPDRPDIVRTMQELGFPSSEIPRFERAFEAGQYLIVARTSELAEAEKIESLMESVGAENAKEYITP